MSNFAGDLELYLRDNEYRFQVSMEESRSDGRLILLVSNHKDMDVIIVRELWNEIVSGYYFIVTSSSPRVQELVDTFMFKGWTNMGWSRDLYKINTKEK